MNDVSDLAELLTFVKSGGKVCPEPPEWNELWLMLPGRERQFDGYWNVKPPLILAAWHVSSDEDKAERLAYHIHWAASHGMLSVAAGFLKRLPAERWHRSCVSRALLFAHLTKGS
jgi:hypothetical protein